MLTLKFLNYLSQNDIVIEEYKNDNVNNVNIELEKTKNSVSLLIDKTIDREGKLEDLDIKSSKLQESSNMFYKKTKKVKKKHFINNKCSCLLIFFILFTLIYLLLSYKCGFDFNKC